MNSTESTVFVGFAVIGGAIATLLYIVAAAVFRF